MSETDQSDVYSEAETAARREATLKAILATPHKPHKPATPRIGVAKRGGIVTKAGIESTASQHRRIQTTLNRT